MMTMRKRVLPLGMAIFLLLTALFPVWAIAEGKATPAEVPMESVSPYRILLTAPGGWTSGKEAAMKVSITDKDKLLYSQQPIPLHPTALTAWAARSSMCRTSLIPRQSRLPRPRRRRSSRPSTSPSAQVCPIRRTATAIRWMCCTLRQPTSSSSRCKQRTASLCQTSYLETGTIHVFSAPATALQKRQFGEIIWMEKEKRLIACDQRRSSHGSVQNRI